MKEFTATDKYTNITYKVHYDYDSHEFIFESEKYGKEVMMFYYYSTGLGTGNTKYDDKRCDDCECWWDDMDNKIYIIWFDDEQKKEIMKLNEKRTFLREIKYKRQKIEDLGKEIKKLEDELKNVKE